MSVRTASVTSALLTRRARALGRYLPQALKGHDRGVHQARVASRRLREAVPVLAGKLEHSKAGKARRKIRRLTRALGGVRELDVTIQLLDELSRSDDLSRPALQDVRLHVMEQRQQKRELMLERLGDVDIEKLKRRLQSVSEALRHDQTGAWRQVLGARLMKRTRRLANAIDNAGQLYSPEQLHQVRIAAKKLRYALELAADSGVKAAVSHVRALKRTQTTLGRLHDLQVLQRHVAAVQARPAGRSAPHQGLDPLAARIEEECRRLHGRYVRQLDTLVDLTHAVPSDIVARLTTPRGRSVKMSLSRTRRAAAVRR
jgi:CHAD domain-containing protein